MRVQVHVLVVVLVLVGTFFGGVASGSKRYRTTVPGDVLDPAAGKPGEDRSSAIRADQPYVACPVCLELARVLHGTYRNSTARAPYRKLTENMVYEDVLDRIVCDQRSWRGLWVRDLDFTAQEGPMGDEVRVVYPLAGRLGAHPPPLYDMLHGVQDTFSKWPQASGGFHADYHNRLQGMLESNMPLSDLLFPPQEYSAHGKCGRKCSTASEVCTEVLDEREGDVAAVFFKGNPTLEQVAAALCYAAPLAQTRDEEAPSDGLVQPTAASLRSRLARVVSGRRCTGVCCDARLETRMVAKTGEIETTATSKHRKRRRRPRPVGPTGGGDTGGTGDDVLCSGSVGSGGVVRARCGDVYGVGSGFADSAAPGWEFEAMTQEAWQGMEDEAKLRLWERESMRDVQSYSMDEQVIGADGKPLSGAAELLRMYGLELIDDEDVPDYDGMSDQDSLGPGRDSMRARPIEPDSPAPVDDGYTWFGTQRVPKFPTEGTPEEAEAWALGVDLSQAPVWDDEGKWQVPDEVLEHINAGAEDGHISEQFAYKPKEYDEFVEWIRQVQEFNQVSDQ